MRDKAIKVFQCKSCKLYLSGYAPMFNHLRIKHGGNYNSFESMLSNYYMISIWTDELNSILTTMDNDQRTKNEAKVEEIINKYAPD